MHILISNDDGYQAPGIRVLADAMQILAERITVIAPDRNRSGASNSLTLYKPLRVHEAQNGYWYVNGTPTDCVHLGITGLVDQEPDMVISGINAGPNLADDVLYSGTVAAAMEGRFLGYPAIAISLNAHQPKYFETAGRVAQELLGKLQNHQLPADTILNVNVPDLPWEEIKGWQVTRLGRRHKSQPMIPDKDPKGLDIYWIGNVGSEKDAGPDTDFHAVNNGFISVTPIKVDLTRYDALDSLRDWLSQ